MKSSNVGSAPILPNVVDESLAQQILWFAKDSVVCGPKTALHRLRAFRSILMSGVFDSEFYNTQVRAVGLTPARLLRHYIIAGYRDGFDPAPSFSTQKYLDFYPDVKMVGQDPLSHFIRFGQSEHRITLPSSAYSGSTASFGRASMDDREPHGWKMAERPFANPSELGPYDIRPCDDVPVEGLRGETFLAKFRLLSPKPDFAGAVSEINTFSSSVDKDPAVSIIVPVYGQLSYTLNCLHALKAHLSAHRFEIILADDASQDESETWLPKLNGVQVFRNAVNRGFLATCNEAATRASGSLLIFLNNDTRVVTGWLDALVATFQTFPKAGLVGSKLFYGNGRLQEAGGIVWSDGSAWNYGRDDDPNRPRYSYARQTDYVSGASIAIPRDLWIKLGGFDTAFAPAYYEDVDLCFRLRAADCETWFQPLSQVIHFEGRTSGTELTEGPKSYQLVNQSRFEQRWRDTLTSHRPNGDQPWLERDRGISKRVLVIDATNPTPWKDAGSLAVTNLFGYYQALGYQVSFVPENFLYERRAVASMQSGGIQCFYAPYESSLAALMQKYGALFDIVHVVRADVAHKCLDLIRQIMPHAQTIFQVCDLHYLRMERQAEVEGRPELATAAAAMKRKELDLLDAYDLTITHSQAEKSLLDEERSGRQVIVMPLIDAVRPTKSPFDERMDFMFLGGYGHPPNVDAAHWLLDEIWPRLSKECRHARLLLVGANPPADIVARAGESVVITGLVDDLQPWFDRTRVFLAALRYGAGVKGKVLSSLAHGVPVVATDIAAEGLSVRDGDSIFLAGSAAEVTDQALRVYGFDKREWSKASRAAQSYVAKNHSFDSNVDRLEKTLKILDRRYKA